jgi:hypothetical protein
VRRSKSRLMFSNESEDQTGYILRHPGIGISQQALPSGRKYRNHEKVTMLTQAALWQMLTLYKQFNYDESCDSCSSI